MVAMLVTESGRNEQSLLRTFQGCFLPNFGSFEKVVSDEKIFLEKPSLKLNREHL
jgi:hypothetical protein